MFNIIAAANPVTLIREVKVRMRVLNPESKMIVKLINMQDSLPDTWCA